MLVPVTMDVDKRATRMSISKYSGLAIEAKTNQVVEHPLNMANLCLLPLVVPLCNSLDLVYVCIHRVPSMQDVIHPQ